MNTIDTRTLEKLDSEVGGLLYDLSETLGLSEVPDGFLEYLMREVEPSPFIDGIEPPDFATFSIMLDDKPLSDHQIEVFSKAGVLTAYGVISKYRLVKQIFLTWGKGSGKDWISARFCAWCSYILLNMSSPQQYLRDRVKTLDDDRINIINIAPKGELAKEVFFEELSRNFSRDIFKPWMIRPKDQILTDRITFPQINLRIISLNSSASGLDGYNPLIWIMDEADAFLDNANKSNADGLRKILVSSATTRWPGRWMGLILSYLRSGSGFMARLIQMYRVKPSPLILIDQAASWDVNPNIREDDPEIQLAFFEDPVAAAAMYRGDVPPVTDPFFGRHEYIRQSLGEHRSPAIIRVHRDIDQLIWRDMNGKQMPYVWPELEHLQREPGRKYYLGVDAGETGDSYTISVVSVADDAELGPGVLCPKCWGSAEAYYKSSIDDYSPVSSTMPRSNLVCQACGSQPTDFVYHTANNAQSVKGWYTRGSVSSKKKLLTVGHEEVEMPHIREDILVGLDPIRKRTLKEMPDGAPVDYLSTQTLLEKLCRGLDVVDAGFDPTQMVSAMQYLSSNTSTNIHKMPFSNKEQFVRLRLLRFLMYSGLTEFAGATAADPNTSEKACIEMEQLQKIGQRIDHPSNGSKDLVDARAIAFYLAIRDNVGESHLEWLFEEKALKSASGQG